MSKVVGVKWRAVFFFGRTYSWAYSGRGSKNSSNFARLVSNELRKSDEGSAMNNLGRRLRVIPNILESCSQFGAATADLGATVRLNNGIR